MHHIFFSASDDDLRARNQQPDQPFGPKLNMWGKTWQKVGCWLKKEGEQGIAAEKEVEPWDVKQAEPQPRTPAASRRPDMAVVPGLPRPITFRRQNSERRDHLYPHEPDAEERRASSIDRRAVENYIRRLSQPPIATPRPSVSAPNMRTPQPQDLVEPVECDGKESRLSDHAVQEEIAGEDEGEDILNDFPPVPPFQVVEPDHQSEGEYERQIQAELEAKWILNLSMHFRDKSDREKFFLTYADEPNKWRRLTVSIDYRNAQPDSLELEIKQQPYQRDKSAYIFKSIRDSLQDIKFYSTVTNLKLQTTDGRIHVHVSEDKQEIIQYPSVSRIAHLPETVRRYKEGDIEFDSHMSGFVYLVRCPEGRRLVKKEIPGPEAVDEFLYEIEALYHLLDSPHVIHLEGLVISDDGTLVKGLLIKHAQEGALVDLLYDFQHGDYLPWQRRAQWAKQIVAGLNDLHEAGFTQGDFTLSNIVIDVEDNAKIIDINRRGCPLGWEPPELLPNIRVGQHISMRIGPKTDLFQLGMVLWALGEQHDEPERQERPLEFSNPAEIPEWYQRIVQNCLSERPRERLHAKELLALFPADPVPGEKRHGPPSMSLAPNRLEKDFIDPAAAVSMEDIDHLKHAQHERGVPSRMSRRSNLDSDATFADVATSTEYVFESSGSFVVGRRDRSAHSSRIGGSRSQSSRQPLEPQIERRGSPADETPRLLPPPMEPVAMPGQLVPSITAAAEAVSSLTPEPGLSVNDACEREDDQEGAVGDGP